MKKDFLFVIFIILFISILATGTKIQSVDEYYITHIDDIKADSKTVTLEINAQSLEHNMEQLKPELRRFIPKDGIILAEEEYVLRSGDTAFSIVERATRYHRIQLEYQGAKDNGFNSVYIQGINYLYEFSAGGNSGWMYAVNNVFPNVGVSKKKLKDGDKIVFYYTTNLGKDLQTKGALN